MSEENVSHAIPRSPAETAAQAEPPDLAAVPEVVFVAVRRAEPSIDSGPLLIATAMLVGIALGRLLERLES